MSTVDYGLDLEKAVERYDTALNGNYTLSVGEITPEQEALLRGLNYREYPDVQELSLGKGNENSEEYNTALKGDYSLPVGEDAGPRSAIQGLEDYSEDDILADATDHIANAQAEGLDINIVDMKVIGSRIAGTARPDSDLDILVEYDGDMKEDAVFNALNDEENRLAIAGINVDFFPIRKEESGTMQNWLASHNNGMPVQEQETAEDMPSDIADSIEQARQEVNVEPTEGQKKAGNYKMGHIKLDGYDISLENPKGSVRKGVDENGKEWESEIKNDYGYLRGTEGVDGDHIDVFLSDTPEQGNVFVVDQVNPKTGEFDEHKVMYGFNTVEEAQAAYLSNYEEGWQGLGNITPVSKEEFKKWVDSSHRKTKPFAEYASVKPLQNVTTSTDNQGNPVDADGKLILEPVASIDELTDADFTAPARNVQLPELPGNVASAIGSTKPVIIKKNVFEKNARKHKDLTPEDGRKILSDVLYSPDLYGQNQNTSRPYNWILIHLADKNESVIVEVDNNKANTEIVNWHYLDAEGLEQKKSQAAREGGLILTIPKGTVAGNTPNGFSTGKGNENSEEYNTALENLESSEREMKSAPGGEARARRRTFAMTRSCGCAARWPLTNKYVQGDEGMSRKGDMPTRMPVDGYYEFMTNPCPWISSGRTAYQ